MKLSIPYSLACITLTLLTRLWDNSMDPRHAWQSAGCIYWAAESTTQPAAPRMQSISERMAGCVLFCGKLLPNSLSISCVR